MADIYVGTRGWSGGAWGVEAWDTPTPSTFFSPLAVTVNSVSLSTHSSVSVAGQSLALSEGVPSIVTTHNLPVYVTGQSLSLSSHSVGLICEAVLDVTGQQLPLTLNEPRFWFPIPH